jgi:hypothetical protein
MGRWKNLKGKQNLSVCPFTTQTYRERERERERE